MYKLESSVEASEAQTRWRRVPASASLADSQPKRSEPLGFA